MGDLLAKIGVLVLNIIYLPIKLFRSKNKVVFISRQSDKASIDFVLLEKVLRKKVTVVILCKTIKVGILNKIKYCFHMLKQMYHIATSKVVVLDSYCIVVSVLKHKKGIVIIQMWHAMGSFKKFGLSLENSNQISGMKIKANSNIKKTMRMHQNYNYIFVSSQSSSKNFCEAFGYSNTVARVFPLPRIDLIKDKNHQKKISAKIFDRYPVLKKKKNILYAPTFREQEQPQYLQQLIDVIDYDKYNLIIKMHPRTQLLTKDKRPIYDDSFQSYEMAYVSDYIITDYSAFIYEASILNKPIFLYCYDLENYYNERNFYLKFEDLPGYKSSDAREIYQAIESNNSDIKKIKIFTKENIENYHNYTNKIATFILKSIK